MMVALSWSSLAVLATCRHVSAFFQESLKGFNLLGDSFGFPSANATYDYVVIGGGTAGLTVANRLAEGGKASVAVIEAGGFYELDNGNYSSVPGTAGYYLGTGPRSINPAIDWLYESAPEEGLGGRRIRYTSGKTLGGGSARNFMFYDRGNVGAYKMWADAVGDKSFEFDSFNKDLQRAVKLTPPNNEARASNSSVKADAEAFGKSGKLHVGFSNYATPWGSWAKEALKELGLKELPDLVSGKLLGYQWSAHTIDTETQTRQSSEVAYLRDSLEDPISQLTVYTNTLAKRILFDDENKAFGVSVEKSGASFNLLAKKEVILSAGAHRSPHLLMLSGVGPRASLEELDIPVVSNLEGVGQNMWDHPYFGPSYSVKVDTASALFNPLRLAQEIGKYKISRTGMFTSTTSDLLAFENLSDDLWESLKPETQKSLKETFPSDWPHVHMFFPSSFFNGSDLTRSPMDGKMYAAIVPVLTATFSRGSITLNSTNPHTNPIIQPNLLTDLRDQDLAVAAFKRARQISNTEAFKKVIIEEASPGENRVESDEDILEYIKSTAGPLWHAAGSCKMGKKEDKEAVVDAKGRVFGVQGLRVVDASVFPVLVPCHPQATVYGLAEKIAADIVGSF